MYHFIKDKDFLMRMRGLCSNIVNQLVQSINSDNELIVEAHLVGSGARNLETQNVNEPVDLDYNLNIVNSKNKQLKALSEQSIKEYIRKIFNEVLNNNGWGDCQDSTSCLTTERRYFTKGNSTEFSIDLAIVHEKLDGTWLRLIHEKTGRVSNDKWYWNEAPHSKGLKKKADKLKSNNHWKEVRDTYLNKKNMYLSRRDYNHPSFNCYIEAVNEVYEKYFK